MSRPLTLLFSVGEPSGDLHGGALAAAIRRRVPDAVLVGMGGANMREAGVDLLIDFGSSSVMGLTEVLRQIPEFLRKRDRLRDWAKTNRPDAAVLIDFPDFNLRLAKALKRLGVPIVYMIPPKAWAWRPKRAAVVADVARVVISILPFEAAFYAQRGANVVYVGHPLVDILREAALPDRESARRKFGLPSEARVLGLLPGSRRREVASLLPPMLGAAERVRRLLPGMRVVVPLASSATDDALGDASGHPVFREAVVVRGDTYAAIRACDAVLVASGTATLETAMLGVPMAIVYKLSPLTWALARPLIRVEHSGLPNLLADERIAPELYQDDVAPEPMADAVLPLLTDPAAAERQRIAFARVMEMLGDGGALDKAADAVLAAASAAR